MRQTFYRFHDAVRYQKYLRRQGIESSICSTYCWEEQRETFTVVPKVTE